LLNDCFIQSLETYIFCGYWRFELVGPLNNDICLLVRREVISTPHINKVDIALRILPQAY
jgi:hypothetical protein